MNAKPQVRVWTAPIVLGVLTAFGLIAALLSDSAGDVLAWLTIGAPVAVVFWYLPRRRPSPPASRPAAFKPSLNP